MPDAPMPSIMIIDDAALVRLYYRELLEQAGFGVAEAANGIEALEKLLVQPADLLIVDINMPKMDGLTFLTTLRRQHAGIAGIPALVTSTEQGEQDFAAARAAGANFYLTKPVPPETLLAHVRLLCGAGA